MNIHPTLEPDAAAMLAHAKRFEQRRIDQGNHQWKRLENDELFGRTVLIVGLGRIGTKIAQLCKAFGTRVIGTKRSVEPVENVDLVFPAARLSRSTSTGALVAASSASTPPFRRILRLQPARCWTDCSSAWSASCRRFRRAGSASGRAGRWSVRRPGSGLSPGSPRSA